MISETLMCIMLTLLLITTIIVCLGYYYNVYTKRYADINKLPGPSSLQLVKDLYFSASTQGIVTYMDGLTEKYGPIVKVWIKPFKPKIITTDMDLCNKIYKAHDHHITPLFYDLTFFGNGIARHPDYDIWKKDKDIIRKAITQDYVANRLLTYNKKYDELFHIIRYNLGKPLNMQKYMYDVLVEIMIATFNDPNVDLSQEEIQNYVEYRRNFFDLLLEKMNSLRMIGIFHKLTENFKLATKCTNDMKTFANDWLQRHRRVEPHLREKYNLIYAMESAGMPDERIVDNINSMIQGGHDTAIRPMSLVFQEMSKCPQIQDKILNEIVSVLGSDINTPITLDNLANMPYTHAVVKESLRLYFPVPFLDRRLLYDMTINNLRIPKGTEVMFNIPGILQSEGNYDDPLVFKPERFLKENITLKGQRAFIPFGYGLKICPGKDIAMAAMKLLIVKLIREFELVPLNEKYVPHIVAEIFYRNTNGIPVVFQKRILK